MSRSRESRIRQAVRRHPEIAAILDVRIVVPHEMPGRESLARFMSDTQPKAEERVEATVRRIAEADPTGCGTYIDWLTGTWKRGYWRFEDTPRVRDDLDLFDRRRVAIARTTPGGADISRYARPSDVLRVVRRFRVEADWDAMRNRPEMMAEPHARVIRHGGLYQAVVPLTAEAAAFWGWDSEWCVTWGVPGSRHPKRTGYFDRYTKDGGFLFVRRRRDDTLWAIHSRDDGEISLWDADDTRQKTPIRALFSDEWPGLLTGAVLDELSVRRPLLAVLASQPADRRARQISLVERSGGAADWSAASSLERAEGIHALPNIVLAMDATSWERRLAIGLAPALVLKMDGATEEERIAAIRRGGLAALLAAGMADLTPAERAAAIGHCPAQAVERLGTLLPEERLLALRAEPACILLLAPLSEAERQAAVEAHPESATMLGEDGA